MNKRLEILTNGIFKENPVWILALGTCPTLATTSTAFGGLGMGVSVLFVLLCSNIVISTLKNIIPNKVRIPSFIVIISGFVTVTMFLIQGFIPDLYKKLGIFLPLIVVNCIILARAEAFASKNTVLDSVFDAIGMGIGFTAALFLLGSIREIFGSGTWFSIGVLPNKWTIPIFSSSSGGFFSFALLIAIMTKPRKSSENCSNCGLCNLGKE